MNYRIYSVALALSLLTACGDKPTPLPQPTPTPTPAPTPTPEPTPPAYKDYEGYTLVFNQGLAAVLTSQPDGVGVASSLSLLDREAKTLLPVFSDKATPLNKEYEGQGYLCEGTLSEAGDYLAYMAKYDFSDDSEHASRLLLFDRKTMRVTKSLRISQPDGDEWVRQSFTLDDGTTYLSFDKKHFYRLDPETGKMTPLSGLYGYASGGAAWQDKGYFFVREKAVAYAFDKGSTSARQIPIARSGAYIKDVFRVGDEWLILRDTANRYYLFSMKEGKVTAIFTLSEAIGRSATFDPATFRLYYSGGDPNLNGGEAKERSVYSAQLDSLRPASEVQGLTAQRLYTIAGRNESNNRQGFKMQVGYHPYLNVVLVAYLDQGRSGPLLHDLTKLLLLQLPTTPSESVKELRTFDLHYASDISLLSVIRPRSTK